MEEKTSRDVLELLRESLEKGIIDAGSVADEIETMQRRDELLKDVHIWNDSRGRWCAHIYENNKRKLIRRNDRKSLEDELVKRLYEGGMTLRAAFDKWNDRRLELGYIEPSTYAIAQETFDRMLKGLADRPLGSLTPESLASYLEALVGRERLTAKAFSNTKSILYGTLKGAKRERLIDFTGADVDRELSIPPKAFRRTEKSDGEQSFTDGELELIRGYAKGHPENPRNLAVLLLSVTGMRVGEMTALRWEDVHDGYLDVRATETRRKNAEGKWEFYVRDSAKTPAGVRTVAVPRSYAWIWDALRRATGSSEGYVFLNAGGERLNTHCIRAHFRRMCEKLGIPPRSPHCLRKSYVTILLEEGVSTRLVTRQVGHTDVATSERYYHKDRTSVEEKIDIVSRIPGLQDRG